MSRPRKTIRIFLCAVMLASVAESQCFYSRCNCIGTEILCGMNAGVTKLEPLSKNYSGFSTLYIAMNQITDIPFGSLPNSLTEIRILDNPLVSIDDTSFDESANTLGTLELSAFRFTRIPDAFCHIHALKVLTLYQSNIQDWNMDAMKNIGQTLDTLSLSNVGLKSWPDWISYFVNLTRLSVVDSAITFLPDGTMDALADKLVHLDLYNNSLTAVPKAISKFTALQELDLRINKISDVSWLPRLSKLQELSLNNNNISDATSLSNALRPYASVASSVYLQSNSLTAIPTLDFLTKVGYLDLGNNKISDPNSGSVPAALFSIDLSYNLLPRVPRFMSKLKSVTDLILPYNAVINTQDVDFPPASQLVELKYNLITELTDSSFPKNSSIQYLHLNNNPLVRISSLAFRNLPVLIELNLSGTRLARLPLALTFLKSLTELEMSDSIHLICTCLEKSLESWIRSVPYVQGDCGHTNISYFFSTLSPSCPER